MSPVMPLITAVYSVVFVVGFVGNCLVMYVVIRYTKMKTATNIYIFNLALADALLTSTMPLQSAWNLLDSWPFGETLCKLCVSVDYYNMFASVLTLTAMSVDRYVAVCHPVRALEFRTPLCATAANVAVWVLSSAAGIPALLLGGTETANGTTTCALRFPDPYEFWDAAVNVCVFVLGLVLPLLVMAGCYARLVQRLRGARALSRARGRGRGRGLRRVTRLVLALVCVFVACWTPIHAFALARALGSVPDSPPVAAAYYACVALGYANSCLNPLLYAVLDQNFRRRFRHFCRPAGPRSHWPSGSRGRSSLRDSALQAEDTDGPA
ncbi:kappa-type opioid receptor-like [Conger conger]|uniref:kappa-type opioid receptor-like n=1 Tax=Conger conger TaxID=82655 RepID=UPI002A5A20D5|nr:kappa-type opioid receptor-like [Conger conger]